MSVWESKYKYIRILIVLVVFGFIFKMIVADWDKITAQPLHIDYRQFLLSYLGICVVLVLHSIFWSRMLRRFQDGLTLLQGVRVWLYSQMGKCLPGKGFIYLGRAFLCQKHGIDKRNSLVSSVVEFGLDVLSGFILVLIAMPFIRNLPIFISKLWIVSFVLIGLIIMHPKIFTSFVNKSLSVFKQEKIELNMGYIDMVRYLFIYLCSQFLLALSFLFFVRAFYFISIDSAPFVAISFIVAYLIGILSFLTPAGLGVREGVLLILLNNVLPSAVAAQIALFSRLWTVMADLTGACLAFVLRKIDGT